MAVIGNKPTLNRQGAIRKQKFTGNGGTSYTLDYNVSGPVDLEVFVNNVRQEPTAAYTASGTSLTMEENINSDDDFYVIFKGETIGTYTHSADQPISATTVNAALAQTGSDSNDIAGNLTLSGTKSELKLVDGNIVFYDGTQNVQNIGASLTRTTGKFRDPIFNRIIMDGEHDSTPGSGPNKLETYSNGWVGGIGLHSATMAYYTGANTDFYKLTSENDSAGASTLHMRIDTNGRVTKPKQPHIFGSPTNTGGSGKANSFALGSYNRGTLTFSNNRITVPIDGLYLITFQTICDSQTGRVDTKIHINGSLLQSALSNTNGSGFQQRTHTLVIELSANDYIEFENADWYNSGVTNYDEWRTASVTLIG